MRISTTSVEYVLVPVRADKAGATFDPTGLTVAIGFAAAGSAPSTYTAGTWETDATTTPSTYYARVLVGTGGVVLTAGEYVVWVKLTDNPEIPARPAGTLIVY